MNNEPFLDLHDLAVLVNYERATTEPRFRHAKLRECSLRSDGMLQFSTVRFPDNLLGLREDVVPTRGFIFDAIPGAGGRNQPDLPVNMKGSPKEHSSVSQLSEQDLETIYWEVRGHDGCFKAIIIFQHIFDMYPQSQSLRIRTAEGDDFITTICSRSIDEYILYEPRAITLSVILPKNKTHITGSEPTMPHSIWHFEHQTDPTKDVYLDLASMQFGAVGKGKGNESFVLGREGGFLAFAHKVCNGAEMYKKSDRIRPGAESPEMDRWLEDLANRVKKRWDERLENKWCGHCGVPLPKPLRCPCGEVFYCDAKHQKSAWKFHKLFCATKKGKK